MGIGFKIYTQMLLKRDGGMQFIGFYFSDSYYIAVSLLLLSLLLYSTVVLMILTQYGTTLLNWFALWQSKLSLQ